MAIFGLGLMHAVAAEIKDELSEQEQAAAAELEQLRQKRIAETDTCIFC